MFGVYSYYPWNELWLYNESEDFPNFAHLQTILFQISYHLNNLKSQHIIAVHWLKTFMRCFALFWQLNVNEFFEIHNVPQTRWTRPHTCGSGSQMTCNNVFQRDTDYLNLWEYCTYYFKCSANSYLYKNSFTVFLLHIVHSIQPSAAMSLLAFCVMYRKGRRCCSYFIICW